MRWRRATERRGFALLAVLWIVAGIALLSLAGSLLARRATATVRNRTNWTVARWHAEGCAARARAFVAPVLIGTPSQVQHGWQALDRILSENGSRLRAAGCEVTLRAAGARLDVNTASREQIQAILMVAGVTDDRADTLADALLDWRDTDDDPRPLGAERAWYVAHRRLLPRNGPLASVRELLRVRGLATVPGIDTLFGVEPGRIALSSAAPATLAALPGFGPEAVAQVLALRRRGIVLSSALELDPLLSRRAFATLHAAYADLSRLSAPAPDAWILTASASAGAPAAVAQVELRLGRSAQRAAILRERVW